MTQFTTITELEILNEAYMNILEKWARADDNYKATERSGFPNKIYKHRRDKYNAQLDELHTAIVALENANDLPDFNSPEAFFCEPD